MFGLKLLGNGLTIRVWQDPWLPQPHLFIPLGYDRYLAKTLNIADLISPAPRVWNLEVLNSYFCQSNVQIIWGIPLCQIQVRIHWCGTTQTLAFLLHIGNYGESRPSFGMTCAFHVQWHPRSGVDSLMELASPP